MRVLKARHLEPTGEARAAPALRLRAVAVGAPQACPEGRAAEFDLVSTCCKTRRQLLAAVRALRQCPAGVDADAVDVMG